MKINITKEQARSFFHSMSESQLGKCEACGCFDKLVRHHWYKEEELKKATKSKEYNLVVEYNKNVCSDCNNLLVWSNMKAYCHKRGYYIESNKSSHALPDWDMQKDFIKDEVINKGKYTKKMERNIAILTIIDKIEAIGER